MLVLNNKSGVIILDKVFYCKLGEHDNIILDYLEKNNIENQDTFIKENIIIFAEEMLYTMDFSDIDLKNEKCLTVIRNSDMKEYLEEQETLRKEGYLN